MRPLKYLRVLPRRSTTLIPSTAARFAPQPGPAIRSYSHGAAPSSNDFAAAVAPPPPANSSPQELLAHYSQIPTRLVKLSDLTRYGMPPLSEEKLLESAERTRKVLLAGLARRVTQHLSLPFLPATNPSLQSIYNLYSTAFFALAALPEIRTLEDNDRLVKAIEEMVEEHRDNIPILAKGFQETRKYLPPDVITQFLDRAIRNRISLRLTAEQHISLSAASLPALRGTSSAPSTSSETAMAVDSTPTPPKDLRVEPSARAPSTSLGTPTRVGILDLALSPYEMIHTCADYVTLLCDSTYGVSPSYRIEGCPPETLVGSIGSHLEYILTELLKNAFRATVEYNTPKREEVEEGVFRFDDLPHAHLSKSDLPEVVITVGVVKGVLTIRIRDRGGGVPAENVAEIFSYAFTSVPTMPNPDSDPDSPSSELYGGASGAGYYGGVGGGPEAAPGQSTLQTSMGTIAGLGFGLPLSRLYAQYNNGSLDLISLPGWGTDVYCVLQVA